ncbi:MAG: acetate--CoA ligase family protein, partial [Methanobacterium sp.]|nr:acetate--CoA ligase family protein [Methanobacterium sp.]
EHSAKKIFQKEGIPIPPGEIARSGEEAQMIAEKMKKAVAIKFHINPLQSSWIQIQY